MSFVIVESPYQGDIPRNVAYAREAMRHSFLLGEVPFASHLLYTQPGILRDEVSEERMLGIAAGLEIALRADKTVVYEDLGISEGMALGIQDAMENGRPVEYRRMYPARQSDRCARGLHEWDRPHGTLGAVCECGQTYFCPHCLHEGWHSDGCRANK